MRLEEAIKAFRMEIGLTQTELANLLHISFATVNRWENQNKRPNQSVSIALINLAKDRKVSASCLDSLNELLLASRTEEKMNSELSINTERIKTFDKGYISNDQFRQAIDNINLGVIIYRFYKESFSEEIIYYNKVLAEIFGYSLKEFNKNFIENPCFAIDNENMNEYLSSIKHLINKDISIEDFDITIKGIKKDKSTIYIRLKAISLNEYSFGKELFTSCQDVTSLVLAQQKYQKEIDYRNISTQCLYSTIICDLSDNKIVRYTDDNHIIGYDLKPLSVNELLKEIISFIPNQDDINKQKVKLNCQELINSYYNNNSLDSFKIYSSISNRWLRLDYYLIKNPFNNHIECLIYVIDIQKETVSTKALEIITDSFFDFIGIINIEKEDIEIFYSSNDIYELNKPKNYFKELKTKLLKLDNQNNLNDEIKYFEINHICKELETQKYYSRKINIENNTSDSSQKISKHIICKNIYYTYMDDYKKTMIIAQSDYDNLSTILNTLSQKYN